MKNCSDKIALTVDIEDWYHTPAVTGSDFSFYKDVPTFFREWNGRYDYLSKPTIDLLNLLSEKKLKATFFVVADVIDNYPKLIDKIIDKGHEIGCHGFHHETNIDTKTKKPLFSVDEFEAITGRAREKLKVHTGQPIIGYRAPGAYIGDWMFESLIKLGFKYDSSVSPNSFFNKTNFNNLQVSSRPYKIKSENRKDYLIEIPFPYFNIGKIKFPTAGGPFLRFFSSKYIIKGLKDSLKRGHSIFYLHSIDICQEKLPKISSMNKRRPFYFITSGIKTRKKFNKILIEFLDNWTTCKTLIDAM